MKIKAVIIVDAEGGYIVHGNSEQTSTEMFKAIQPLWSFDPATEHAHYVEIEVALPGEEPDYYPYHEQDGYDAPATDAG